MNFPPLGRGVRFTICLIGTIVLAISSFAWLSHSADTQITSSKEHKQTKDRSESRSATTAPIATAAPSVPQVLPNAEPKKKALTGQAAITHLKQVNEYESLVSAVKQAEAKDEANSYEVRESEGGEKIADNPRQGYSTRFTEKGVELSASSKIDSPWSFAMQLRGYGYGDSIRELVPVRAESTGNEYHQDWIPKVGKEGGLTEWYINKPEGLEQGFTIPEAPLSPGDSASEDEKAKLTLRLTLTSDMKAEANAEGTAIDLTGPDMRVLRYDHLVAEDSEGTNLDARMRVEGGEIVLEVDDKDAVYPVTIDPTVTVTQLQKLTASDAASGYRFGSSVAVDGNYAVVGAQSAVVGGVASGAAYVFARKGTPYGTKWTEVQKLTPRAPRAGANFGVDVGIYGDTIVVGASGDYSTANVQTGLLYVFTLNGTRWRQIHSFFPSGSTSGSGVGSSVSIYDNTIAFAGNTSSNRVWVYVRNGSTWGAQQTLTVSGSKNMGWGGLSVYKDTIAVADESNDYGTTTANGAVYTFVRSGTSWSQNQTIRRDISTYGRFGRSGVSLSEDTLVSEDRVIAQIIFTPPLVQLLISLKGLIDRLTRVSVLQML